MFKRNNRRHDRGAAAVEFALVLPIFVLIIVGLINFGQAFFTKVSLDHSAREAVRVAALGGNASDNVSKTFSDKQTTVGVSVVGCVNSGDEAKVTLNATMTYWMPFPGFKTQNMKAVGVATCY